MRFRITFEIMEVAESRAFAIANIMWSEADMELAILSVEEVKE